MKTSKDIADMIRSVVETQVRTTASGKKLTAFDQAAVENLISNIVGNLATVVEYEIVESIEETIEMSVAA